MRHKTAELIETKADDRGTFTALASVFGNVDLVGDRMLPGAFSKTLERWRATGDPIPVILSHQWDDPMAIIGHADPNNVVESDRGLEVRGELDIADNPIARQVHKLLGRRVLKGFSFGYTVPNGGEKLKDGVNEVSEVDLIELGPTLKGANPLAQLETVKSALGVKTANVPEQMLADAAQVVEWAQSPEGAAYRDFFKKNQAAAQIRDSLTSAAEELSDQDQDSANEDATARSPDEAKPVAQDSLKAESRRIMLDILSGGASRQKYDPPKPPPAPDIPSEQDQWKRWAKSRL